MANKPKAQVAPVVPFVAPVGSSAAFLSGTEMAVSERAQDAQNQARFGALNNPAERKEFRAGFVACYMHNEQCEQKTADNRFDYLAGKFAPAKSSRKRKGKGKAGRKEKTETGTEIKVEPKAAVSRVIAALAHVAKGQQDFSANPVMLAWLGAQAAILNGEAPESK